MFLHSHLTFFPPRLRVIEPTAFRKFYERGDLPIAIHHAGLGNKLKWKVRMIPFIGRLRSSCVS